MRGIFGQRRSFGGGRGVWLGIGILAILALLTRRHEKAANTIRAAYRTAWERVGGREQPMRHDADFSSEQAGGSLAQEHSEEETEVGTAEAEADPGEGTKGITRESAGRNEGGDGGEEESQEDKSAAAAEEGRSDAERLPIEDYDMLTVTQVTQRLRGLSLEEVEQLRDYEAENRNRRSIMQRFDTRIRAAQKNLEKRGDGETEEGSGE